MPSRKKNAVKKFLNDNVLSTSYKREISKAVNNLPDNLNARQVKQVIKDEYLNNRERFSRINRGDWYDRVTKERVPWGKVRRDYLRKTRLNQIRRLQKSENITWNEAQSKYKQATEGKTATQIFAAFGS